MRDDDRGAVRERRWQRNKKELVKVVSTRFHFD